MRSNVLPVYYVTVESRIGSISETEIRTAVSMIQKASTRLGLPIQAKFNNVTCYFMPDENIPEETIINMISLVKGHLVVDNFCFYKI